MLSQSAVRTLWSSAEGMLPPGGVGTILHHRLINAVLPSHWWFDGQEIMPFLLLNTLYQLHYTVRAEP